MKSHESEIKIKITRYKKISKRDLCADNIVDLSQKDNFLFSLFKNSLVKITALLLIIVLNWAGIYAIGSTLGYFGDKEISVENKLEAGILDFELASEHDFLPSPLNLGEYATRTISIINNANLFKYTASSTDFSSEVCQYFDLVADMDDVTAEYSGKLTDFNISSSSLLYFSDPEDWFFKLTPVNNFPNDLLGQTCSFKFVFEGSQTRNDLSFLEGFTDREEISNSIAVKKACRCVSLRSMGFWKNHPEIYKDYLPQELGCQMVNFIEDANNIFKKANARNMADQLKAQLLAMKFNLAHFDVGDYEYKPGHTLNSLVAEADALLCQSPAPSRCDLEKIKNLLQCLNNLCFRYCPQKMDDELSAFGNGCNVCQDSEEKPFILIEGENVDVEGNFLDEAVSLPELPEIPQVTAPEIILPEMPVLPEMPTTTPVIEIPEIPAIPEIPKKENFTADIKQDVKAEAIINIEENNNN